MMARRKLRLHKWKENNKNDTLNIIYSLLKWLKNPFRVHSLCFFFLDDHYQCFELVVGAIEGGKNTKIASHSIVIIIIPL